MLSNKAIEEFQSIYKKKYGKSLPLNEAIQQAENLIILFKVIYKPIKQHGK